MTTIRYGRKSGLHTFYFNTLVFVLKRYHPSVDIAPCTNDCLTNLIYSSIVRLGCGCWKMGDRYNKPLLYNTRIPACHGWWGLESKYLQSHKQEQAPQLHGLNLRCVSKWPPGRVPALSLPVEVERLVPTRTENHEVYESRVWSWNDYEYTAFCKNNSTTHSRIGRGVRQFIIEQC